MPRLARSLRLAVLLLGLVSLPGRALAQWWDDAQFGIGYEVHESPNGVAVGKRYPLLSAYRADSRVVSAPGPLTGRVMTALNGRRIASVAQFRAAADHASFHDDPDSAFAITFTDSRAPVRVPVCLEGDALDAPRCIYDRWDPALVGFALRTAGDQLPQKNFVARFSHGELQYFVNMGYAPDTTWSRVYSIFARDSIGFVVGIDLERDDREIVEPGVQRGGVPYEFTSTGALDAAHTRLELHPGFPQTTLRRALRGIVSAANRANIEARDMLLAKSVEDLEAIRFPDDGDDVDIVLTQAWTPTGITVEPGDSVLVEASGSMDWCTGGCPNSADHVVGPDGRSCTFGRIAPRLKCWSLIGKIGEDGLPFQLGSASTIHVLGGGPLFLGVNDGPGDYGDNTGSWHATIEVYKREQVPRRSH